MYILPAEFRNCPSRIKQLGTTSNRLLVCFSKFKILNRQDRIINYCSFMKQNIKYSSIIINTWTFYTFCECILSLSTKEKRIIQIKIPFFKIISTKIHLTTGHIDICLRGYNFENKCLSIKKMKGHLHTH